VIDRGICYDRYIADTVTPAGEALFPLTCSSARTAPRYPWRPKNGTLILSAADGASQVMKV